MLYNLLEEEIESIIHKYLPINIINKKVFGEVFTPTCLINNMLDRLPLNIFENPHLKWLDPCAGIGNFMLIIYFRLMKGLKLWEINLEKRSNHILQNMLYMIEINKENVKVAFNIFTYENMNANIICQDFLLYSNTFLCKFDIIIGNPPFQLKSGKGSKNKLYEKIIAKCLPLINVNGYLYLLVPDNLFAGNSSKIYKELIKYNIEWIDFSNIWTNAFGKIQQNICCFLLENKDIETKVKTKILNNNSLQILLKDRPINPIRNWTKDLELLIDKYLLNNKNNNIIYNRGQNINCYSNTYSVNTYSIIYTVKDRLYSSDLNLVKGLHVKKIIIFIINTKNEYYIDWNGEYGAGPNTIYIPFTNEIEGQKLDAFLKSEIYHLLMGSCKTCRQFIKIGLIQYLNLDLIIK
jgi:hypothetical protein